MELQQENPKFLPPFCKAPPDFLRHTNTQTHKHTNTQHPLESNTRPHAGSNSLPAPSLSRRNAGRVQSPRPDGPPGMRKWLTNPILCGCRKGSHWICGAFVGTLPVLEVQKEDLEGSLQVQAMTIADSKLTLVSGGFVSRGSKKVTFRSNHLGNPSTQSVYAGIETCEHTLNAWLSNKVRART